MGLKALHIELGLNIVLIIFGGPGVEDTFTYALVSFVATGIPEVRFAPREFDTLVIAVGDAWRSLVLNPDTPVKMRGVGGQDGWRTYLRTQYGVGFVFVTDAFSRGVDLPEGASVIDIDEYLKSKGIEPDMF